MSASQMFFDQNTWHQVIDSDFERKKRFLLILSAAWCRLFNRLILKIKARLHYGRNRKNLTAFGKQKYFRSFTKTRQLTTYLYTRKMVLLNKLSNAFRNIVQGTS